MVNTTLRRASCAGTVAAARPHLLQVVPPVRRRPASAAGAAAEAAAVPSPQQQQPPAKKAAVVVVIAPPPPPPSATRLAAALAPAPPKPAPPAAAAAAAAASAERAAAQRAGSLGFPLDFDASYELGDVIGAGASGRVHHARHRATGRRVAVKVLPKRHGGSSSSGSSSKGGARPADSSSSSSPSPLAARTPSCRAAAIRREVGAIALAAAGSPYAARLEGVYESDDDALLVMERCEGGDLRSVLAARRGEPLPEAAAAAVLAGVLHALAACHARGMVYGDVKPSNVCMLRRQSSVEREVVASASASSSSSSTSSSDEEGGDLSAAAGSAHPPPAEAAAVQAECQRVFFGGVRLVDWGAAAPAPLSPRSLAGSPLYWSPEQAVGYAAAGGALAATGGSGSDEDGAVGGGAPCGAPRGYGPAVDVWAAGVLAFQMMSGRLPYWPAATSGRQRQGGGEGEEGGNGVPRGLRPWQLLAAIRTAPLGAWPGASAEARDLVSRMLERDPEARITAAQALAHPFFARYRAAPAAVVPAR